MRAAKRTSSRSSSGTRDSTECAIDIVSSLWRRSDTIFVGELGPQHLRFEGRVVVEVLVEVRRGSRS